MKYFKLILLFLLFQTNSFAQDDIGQLVKQFCLNNPTKMDDLEKIKQHTDVVKIGAAIQEFVADTLHTDFTSTIFLIQQVRKKHPTNLLFQQNLANSLTEIALANKKQAASAIMSLQAFERDAFSTETRDNILLVISYNDLARVEAIEILGFVGKGDDIDFLKGITSFTKIGKKEKYKIQLALVRLGDAESVELYVNEIKSRTISDQMVYSIMPDMLYTRNKQVFDYLLSDMLNDIPRCYSANNDSEEKILCAYRILEEITPYILRFPIEVNDSGAIEGDYELALEKVRAWITNSQLEYTINTSIF